MAGIESVNTVSDVADLVERIKWSDLPASTVDAARRATLQVLGTTFLGADREISRHVLAYAEHTAPGNATMFGHGATIAPGEAAFANATACHADFRDDAHSASQSHPGVTVIPAALAAAEILGEPLPTGRFGEAVVAGYQVIGRLGRLGAIQSTERGFRASAIYTGFGAAVAVARILGLDRAQLESAIALTAHTAAGLNQPYLDGTDDWILLPGLSARAGLMSALLAREGIVGAPRMLEGEIGFYHAYAGVDPREVRPINVPDWEIETTRLKTMLTCGWNQASTNALVMSGVALDSIDRIAVEVSPEAYEFPGVANPGPYGSYTAAALSLPFAMGTLLSTGHLDSRSYRDVNDPAVAAAASGRVTVAPRSDFHSYDSEVTVTFHDGRTERIPSLGDEARWLLTVDEVSASLREKFAISELDTAIVDRLAAAIPDALAGTSVEGVLEIIGRGAH